MKAYNINIAHRQGLNLEDGRGISAALRHGILRSFRKHFGADDPYCLRRRLLRTVLKRIAVVAILCLPAAGVMGSAPFHQQRSPVRKLFLNAAPAPAFFPSN